MTTNKVGLIMLPTRMSTWMTSKALLVFPSLLDIIMVWGLKLVSYLQIFFNKACHIGLIADLQSTRNLLTPTFSTVTYMKRGFGCCCIPKGLWYVNSTSSQLSSFSVTLVILSNSIGNTKITLQLTSKLFSNLQSKVSSVSHHIHLEWDLFHLV